MYKRINELYTVEKCTDISFEFKPLKNKAVYGIEMKIWASSFVPLNKEIEEKTTIIKEDIPEEIKEYKWWEE